MNRPPGKPDAGEELDLDEDFEPSAPRSAPPQPRPAPQQRPAARPAPTAASDDYAMPVDEPMLDLDGTSTEGLDLADTGRQAGTVFQGQAAVDARELEFGQDVGAEPDSDRMPSGIFDTSEVDLAAGQLPGERERLPTLEATPWEPVSGGVGDTDEHPALQNTPWEPAPGTGQQPGLEATPWEPPPGTGQQPGLQPTPWEPGPGGQLDTGPRELDFGEQGAPQIAPDEAQAATGARELDFGDDGGAAAASQPTPWEPPGAGPAPDEGDSLGDIELAMDPSRPEDASAGTVFEGGVPDMSPTGEQPAVDGQGLDLSQRGPPDASLLTGEYPAQAGSGEFAAVPAEGKARLTAVRELFRLVDKTIKALNLYEGTEESCERQIAQTYNHLVEVLRAFGSLTLTVTPYEFLMEEEAVYTTEEDRRGITYRLFRDEVRELEILPHISREELVDLLEILRAVQAKNGEEDTVTLLWERNFNGLYYRAVDFFLEGMLVAESEAFQARVEQLMAEPARPLHRAQEPVQAGRQVMSQLTRELLQQAAQQRADCLAALGGIGEDQQEQAVQQDPESITEDLWQRTMQILVRMMELGRGPETSRVLVQVMEEMMADGRWGMLGASCKALAQVIRRGAVRSPDATRGLQDALTHLCSGNRLLALHNMLAGCTMPQFYQLAELLRILPRDADPQLVVLVSRMPQNPVQEQMVELLKERDVDLTDFLAQRLGSSNLMHVLAAIEDLRKLGSKKAVAALRKASVHPSPRVRLEALRALTDHLDPSLGPQLVSALTQPHRDLRDLSLTLLERFQPDRALVPHMVEIARREDFDDWGPDHRTRLLKLLVRWGGQEVNEFVIKTVTALNPLRRKRVETLRMEMIRSLGETGGKRSQRLLRACLDYRPSRAIRSAIELALRQVEHAP